MYIYLLVSCWVGIVISPILGALAFVSFVVLWMWLAREGQNPMPRLEFSADEAAKSGLDALQASSLEIGEQRCRFSTSDGGNVEGIVTMPAQRNSDLGVVLTHPWKVMGGNMHNNVPTELARYFAAIGHVAVRFDFRGFGISKGAREVDDVCAAVRYLLDSKEFGVKSVVLVGYSHGSIVAGAAVDSIKEIAGLVLISPPWPFSWILFLGNSGALERQSVSKKPKLSILGAWDVFTPPSFWWARLSKYPPPMKGVLVRGCSHFWIGAEMSLFGRIVEWMKDVSLI